MSIVSIASIPLTLFHIILEQSYCGKTFNMKSELSNVILLYSSIFVVLTTNNKRARRDCAHTQSHFWKDVINVGLRIRRDIWNSTSTLFSFLLHGPQRYVRRMAKSETHCSVKPGKNAKPAQAVRKKVSQAFRGRGVGSCQPSAHRAQSAKMCACADRFLFFLLLFNKLY